MRVGCRWRVTRHAGCSDVLSSSSLLISLAARYAGRRHSSRSSTRATVCSHRTSHHIAIASQILVESQRMCSAVQRGQAEDRIGIGLGRTRTVHIPDGERAHRGARVRPDAAAASARARADCATCRARPTRQQQPPESDKEVSCECTSDSRGPNRWASEIQNTL